MMSELKAHPVVGAYILLAMVYSLAIVVDMGLGMLGLPHLLLNTGLSFTHVWFSLSASVVAFYLNHRCKLDCLGLPKPVFAAMLLGGLVPLALFAGIAVGVELGLITFPG